jgi:hypothetical protein
MRNIIFLQLLILLSFFLTAQGQYYSQIDVVKSETHLNQLTVNVSGYGKNQLTAERNAIRDLFMTILFRGIPGSPSIRPLIGNNETEVLNKNKRYFTQFFENGRYKSFVNKLNCSQLEKANKQKKVICTITVNIQSLKDDLRENKLMTDYGF